MRTPTIHLNGTSRERLAEDYANAAGAVRKAINALNDAAPNGRDYYPQGDAAIGEATREHLERLHKLEAVRDELSAIAQAILGDA